MPVTAASAGWFLTPANGNQRYNAESYDDMADALAAVLAAAPTTWAITGVGTLNRITSEIRIAPAAAYQETGSKFVADVPYRAPAGLGIGGGIRRVRISGDISPNTITIYKTEDGTVTAFGTGASASDYQGQIAVDEDGTVNGASVEQGVSSFEATFEVPKANFTGAYLSVLKSLANPRNTVNEDVLQMNIGTVDDPEIVVFPARTLRYRGARYGMNDLGNWDVTCMFAEAPDVSYEMSFTRGSGSSETKTVTAGGHDEIWYPQKRVLAIIDGKPVIVSRPRAAMVHEVYPSGDLTLLQIPAN